MARFIAKLIAVLCLTSTAQAEVELAKVFANDMVIQRGKAVSIWGDADPGEKVVVTFKGKDYSGRADSHGRFIVKLPAQKASTGEIIAVRASNEILLSNVAFGDLYLASGQSNMAYTIAQVISNFAGEDELEEYPDVRQFNVGHHYQFEGPLRRLKSGQWLTASQATINRFSAVGWFFAKDLYARTAVPIGLIYSTVGATPVEAWMSIDALAVNKDAQAFAQNMARAEFARATQDHYDKKILTWLDKHAAPDAGLKDGFSNVEYDDSRWAKTQIPGLLPRKLYKHHNVTIWLRKYFTRPDSQDDVQIAIADLRGDQRVFVNGVELANDVEAASNVYRIKSSLLRDRQNLIAIRYGIVRQRDSLSISAPYLVTAQSVAVDELERKTLAGEWRYSVGVPSKKIPFRLKHDTSLIFKPVGLYNAMIAPLENISLAGVIWYQGESNTSDPDFYSDKFVALINNWRALFNDPQLPFFYVQLANYMASSEQPQESNWAILRDEQAKTLRMIDQVAMASAIDVGEAFDIHPRDKKTVGERLAMAARAMNYGEQIEFRNPLVDFAKIERIESTISTVRVKLKPIALPILVRGDQPMSFAVAGDDKEFVWADARLEGNDILLKSSVAKPRYIRYAWANNPDTANLYGSNGLPLTPFSIELSSH